VEPYFYFSGDTTIEEIEYILKGYIKRAEVVKKFRPIGYQCEKVDMFMVTLKNPRNTPECRKLLSIALGDKIEGIYEADILFRNRYLIDSGVNGCSIIEFDNVGKDLKGYGLNCKEMYIVGKEDIRLTDERMNFEY
jgi:DNA polymerase I